MLYKIDDKYYIKVQGYYKEVTVSGRGNNLDIKPKSGSKIEVAKAKNVKVVDTEKENFNKSSKLNKEHIDKDWR